jgi:acyl-CoA synthetase (AMP-forming)/AMP-acid ligase II
MDGLMMDFQLTLPPVLQRAETYFGSQEIVSRLPDRSFHTYSFAKWLPDRFEFLDEIPKTAVGRFRKTALGEQFVGESVAS